MKIAIMQPYFLPYLGYFQLIEAVDIWICMDHATFIKKGYMHRNKILDDIPIRVPLIGASSNRNTSEILVDLNSRDWHKLEKTLCQKYSNTPYFTVAKRILDNAKSKNIGSLSSFNFALIQGIADYLGIQTRLIPSSLGMTQQSRSDGIIEITKGFNGTTYINAPGGVDLYSKSYFAEKELKLQFIKPNLKGEFLEMSIFHLLCCYSRDEINLELKKYTFT